MKKNKQLDVLQSTPNQDEISKRAYTIWQARGCPAGQDQDIWLEAERELGAERSPAKTQRTAQKMANFEDRVGSRLADFGEQNGSRSATSL